MYAHTHIYIYIYISQHVDHPNINVLCLGGGTRCIYTYMDMYLKYLLGSIAIVGYCIPVRCSATWLSMPKKGYNGLMMIYMISLLKLH